MAKNVFEKGNTLVADYLFLKEFYKCLCQYGGETGVYIFQSCMAKIENIKHRITECVDILQAYEQKKTKRMILVANGNGMVTLAKNGTQISLADYAKIRWRNYKTATRDLLRATFSREVLSTHSLTGKPSHAFLNENKVLKPQLEPSIVEDIIAAVTSYFRQTESTIRVVITSKCADENKLMRKRIANKQKSNTDPIRVSTEKSQDSEEENVDEVENVQESESTSERHINISPRTNGSLEIAVASTSRSDNNSTVTNTVKTDDSVAVTSTSKADGSSKVSSSFDTDNDLAIASNSKTV